MLISAILVLLVVFAIFVSGLRITREYQRAVVFRLGRYNDLRGPGLFWLIPFGIENETRIDLRIVTNPSAAGVLENPMRLQRTSSASNLS